MHPSAADDFYTGFGQTLHRLASKLLRDERPSHTLQTTALVNEAWLKMRSLPTEGISEDDRVGVAARAMRQVLVDSARARNALKRGGEGQSVTLYDEVVAGLPTPDDRLDLSAALEALERAHPRPAEVVVLRGIASYTVDETAEFLNVSPRTVKGDWQFGMAFLRRHLDSAR